MREGERTRERERLATHSKKEEETRSHSRGGRLVRHFWSVQRMILALLFVSEGEKVGGWVVGWLVGRVGKLMGHYLLAPFLHVAFSWH